MKVEHLPGVASNPELMDALGLSAKQRERIERQRKNVEDMAKIACSTQVDSYNLSVDRTKPAVRVRNQDGTFTSNPGRPVWTCPHCDYLGLFSYRTHRDTRHLEGHTPLDPGQLCGFGCGQLATQRVYKSVPCCSDRGNKCPASMARRRAKALAKKAAVGL